MWGGVGGVSCLPVSVATGHWLRGTMPCGVAIREKGCRVPGGMAGLQEPNRKLLCSPPEKWSSCAVCENPAGAPVAPA